MKKLISHIIAFFVALIFAIVFYVKTMDMPKAAYELPRILSYLIIALAVAMLIEALMAYRKLLKSGQIEPSEEMKVVRVILFLVMIGVYIFTIEKIGYFIMTPIFLLSSFFYLKSTKKQTIIFITIGFTLFIYLLFVKLLNSPIPLGPMS